MTIDAPEVWLPYGTDEIEGLPGTLTYRFWDGDQDFPADPADCAFYAVPYMKGSEVAVRPLPASRAEVLPVDEPARPRVRGVAGRRPRETSGSGARSATWSSAAG